MRSGSFIVAFVAAALGTAASGVALSGCLDMAAARTTDRVSLALLPGCAPEETFRSISVSALGDFPPTDETTISAAGPGGTLSLDSFPDDTAGLRVSARAEVSGVGPGADEWGALVDVPYGSGAVRGLLLPLRVSCPLGDSEAFLAPGAAVVGDGAGGLWAAGGLSVADGDLASRRLWYLAPGTALASLLADGLSDRRAFASLTAMNDRVVLVGGLPGLAGPALDTFEVLRSVGGKPTLALRGTICTENEACTGVVDHVAVPLDASHLLIAGGRSAAGGQANAVVTIVDVTTGAVDRDVPPLPEPRASAVSVVLDDGTVLLAGGEDEDGGPHRAVLAYDAPSQMFVNAFTEEGEPLELDVPEGAQWIAVGGGRAVLIGGDDTGSAVLLARVPPEDGVPVMRVGVLENLLPAGLESLRGASQRSGEVLVTARENGSPVSYLLDLGRNARATRDASRAGAALVALQGGVFASEDDDGTSLTRDSLANHFDAPPNSYLPGGAEDLALGAPGAWSVERGRMVALVSHARFDVPALTFASLRVRLRAQSGTTLLLTRAGLPPLRIALDPGEVALGLCSLPRSDDEEVVVERSGDRLTLRVGDTHKVCTEPGLTGRVGVAVRALEGAAVESVGIERL